MKSQIEHEIQWLLNEASKVKEQMKKRPSKWRHLRDIERQIEERKMKLQNSWPSETMKKQIAKIIHFRSQKVGGIRFVRLGKFCFSFCVSRKGGAAKTLRKAPKRLVLDT